MRKCYIFIHAVYFRITCIGTMQLNRKGIPDELKETENRELLSSEIYWDKNSPFSISLFEVKKSKGKKKRM